MVTALLFLAIQTLYAQPGRFGLPACDGPDQHLASRAAFTLCHSNTRRVPVWTAYQLTPEMLEAPSAPRQHFRPTPNSPHPLLRPNAVPQLPELNLSAWRKIENDIRKLASHSDSLIILTGTLFDCDNIQHIGPNQIAVPCATFKIAIALSGETKSAYAVILPNHPAATRQTVSIREVEQRAGLDFHSALPEAEQDTLESTATPLR